jgi:Acyl-CoA dehydrogenases
MSEHRIFFRETVERILADALDKADIDAAEERILPARLYEALNENGIPLMLVSEDKGGIGATVADAAAILRAMGEASAPGPILETMLGQQLLASVGLEFSPGLISLVFVDGIDVPELGATEWSNATVHAVPWGAAADHVLIVARTAAGTQLIVTNGADWTATPERDAAGEPRDNLSARSLPVTVIALANGDAYLRAAAVLRAAQCLGAIEWAFRRSVEYTGERKQFGREIGKFQAIQQMLAELAGHVLACVGLVEAAAEGMNPQLIAAARSRLGDAIDATITITHQVHGAMGFSLEYSLNSRTRRLMAWRDDFGSTLYWRRMLAREFTHLQRDEFWPAVADSGLAAVG